MNNGKRRVVVTGTGMITPLGHNVADTWDAIMAGKSGFGPYTILPKDGHRTPGLCEVKNFDPTDYLSRRDARRRDRAQLLMSVAANEAMAQSGLEITDANREQTGVYIGTGIGGATTLINQEHEIQAKGPLRASPMAIVMIMPNGAGGMIAIDHGIKGPATTIATACAAANDAIGHAMRLIQWGELDAVVAGGMESIMTHVTIGGFEVARATTKHESRTPRPFDLNRDGLAVGEGAGAMVLESLDHAQARGATILGELIGYGQTTDSHHITAPPPDGSGAARAMRKAMTDARLNQDEVDYINAHGTGTKLNDAAETNAIKTVLGKAAYHTAVSSTKSMTGHIMGGTAAIEGIFCLLAMRDGVLPQTIHYEVPDPACDLDYVPNQPRPAQIDVCMSNAFGFGGHNSVMIYKRFR